MPSRWTIPHDAAIRTLDSSLVRDEDHRVADDAFLAAGDALVLLAASVVTQELNLLLTMRHADMTRVTVRDNVPFRLDPRLLSKPFGRS